MEVKTGYLGLVAAVIRSGLDEDVEYPLTTDGRHWCSLGNLDPEYVLRRANKSYARSSVPVANIQE